MAVFLLGCSAKVCLSIEKIRVDQVSQKADELDCNSLRCCWGRVSPRNWFAIWGGKCSYTCL